MTGKEYLSQAFYIDKKINCKIELLEKLNTMATKATTVISDMPSTPSRDTSRTETIICKIIDLQGEINKRIEELIELKRNIFDLLALVENSDYRMVLELRYMNFEQWESIADTMNCSLRRIYQMHGNALHEVDRQLEKKLKKN